MDFDVVALLNGQDDQLPSTDFGSVRDLGALLAARDVRVSERATDDALLRIFAGDLRALRQVCGRDEAVVKLQQTTVAADHRSHLAIVASDREAIIRLPVSQSVRRPRRVAFRE